MGGGHANTASGIGSVVGGGGDDGSSTIGNLASGKASTVPGGLGNQANGDYSFAAGDSAQANHNGSFVWADASGSPFASTDIDQFNVRATHGVRFVTGGAGVTIDGVLVGTGGGGGGSTNGWLLTGNTGANPASGYFLGTLDNNPVELHVNGYRALRLEPGGGTPNVIGGSAVNTVVSAFGATIGGGDYNTNSANSGTIAGGTHNLASGQSSTVSGGAGNNATGTGWATVGGGSANTASGLTATVPGGQNNIAAGTGSFAAGQSAQTFYDGSFIWGDGTQIASATGPNRFEVLATGGINLYPGGANVSIASPSALAFGSSTRQMISLYNNGTYQYGIGVQTSTLYQRAGIGGGFAWYSGGVHNDGQDNNGGGATLMTLDGSGNLNVTANASVCTLSIRGGCDVAEPFEMSTPAIAAGSVVVIDEQHAGHLKLSDRAYDTRVAGIVSGANGINPGIAMHQDGVLQDGQNVALSGRVYVLADASSSPIVPGDLLTTSATPGHAMKVTDSARAQGTILGKAMTSLKEGKGMVLVLVTLQ